jgi:hypothetical protein
MTRLHCATAIGPLPAIFFAVSFAFTRSSACGTTAFTSPIRSASSAPIMSPV